MICSNLDVPISQEEMQQHLENAKWRLRCQLQDFIGTVSDIMSHFMRIYLCHWFPVYCAANSWTDHSTVDLRTLGISLCLLIIVSLQFLLLWWAKWKEKNQIFLDKYWWISFASLQKVDYIFASLHSYAVRIVYANIQKCRGIWFSLYRSLSVFMTCLEWQVLFLFHASLHTSFHIDLLLWKFDMYIYIYILIWT